MLANVLVALAVVLHLVIATVLVRKYLRTRDIGFVWLGIAVVIWPLVSAILQNGESALVDNLVRGQLVGFYPFSLVERGQMTVGSLVASFGILHQLVEVSLLLVAVVCLYKSKSDNTLRAPS
jgi:hypothetical protein